MADIFKAKAGTLIKSSVQSAGFVTVDGLDSLLRGGKMLGTSFKLDRGQDVLTLKTLSNLYYLYSFGETPGRIMVGGLLFFADCKSGAGTQVVGDINGFYEKNNAWARTDPISIAVGGASFKCLLVNLSVSADTNPYNYASFSLGFTIIPASSSTSDTKAAGSQGDSSFGADGGFKGFGTTSLSGASIQASSSIQGASLLQ